MKLVRSIRAMRWGSPSTVLIITALACYCGFWQARAHERTLVSLQTCLLTCPHPEKLTQSLAELLRLLQDDSRRVRSDAARLELARDHRRKFDAALQDARRTFEEQRERWQQLQATGRRNRDADHRAQTLIISLSQILNRMSESASLEEVSPAGVTTEDGVVSGDPLDSSRRARTIITFRENVWEAIDLIKQLSDPAERLLGQYHDAGDRVKFAWLVTGALGAAGSLLALLMHVQLRVSLWEPLSELRNSLEAISNRDYREAAVAPAAPEIVAMHGSLADIRNRLASAETDMARNVDDRSKQRVRSERLAGIGLLATGVAHEINNPLTAIVGAAEGLQWRLSELAGKLPSGDAEIVREYLAMIQEESKRCRMITSKLLDFARGREGERSLYDVTAIVHEVIDMFRHVRQYQSRTIEVNRIDPCRAWCNGPEIKQVIINLVANALQATTDDGRLEICITPKPDHIEMVFRDTGSGMTPETLEHLFDPFYSTKGPGQGTGLGLSISHAIVDQHQGTLEADSAGLGTGSTFRMKLPACEASARAVAQRRAA